MRNPSTGVRWRPRSAGQVPWTSMDVHPRPQANGERPRVSSGAGLASAARRREQFIDVEYGGERPVDLDSSALGINLIGRRVLPKTQTDDPSLGEIDQPVGEDARLGVGGALGHQVVR